jgi:hypothetical protein
MQSITTKQDLGCGFFAEFDREGRGYMRAPDGERYAQKAGVSPLLGCEVDCCLNIPVAEYRAKCAWLVLFALPKGAIALLYRLIDFTLLGSVRRGWAYGNRSLRQVKFKSGHDLSKIHYFALKRVCIYAYHCSVCLISDMLKIATFPICLSWMQIFAIFGLIFPHHARFLISKLQILWEYDNLLHRVALAHGHSPRWFNSSCVFDVAPCFHSIEYFDKLNLYMYLWLVHEEETRSLCLPFFHTFRDYRALFTEDDYEQFIKILAHIKRVIRRLSPDSRKETKMINGFLVIKHKTVASLIEEIRSQLHVFDSEGQRLCQEMEDQLKTTSGCAAKIQAIRDFKGKMGEKLICSKEIKKTKLSLRREYIRKWIERGHRRLHQYIDGQINLEELKRYLTFEDSALNFKRIFLQTN